MIALFVVFVALRAANVAATTCPGTSLTDAERDFILQLHNDARRTVAQGTVKTSLGTVGPAQNMYQLTYDCNLETAAETAAGANCNAAVDGTTNGDNVQLFTAANSIATTKNDQIQQAVADWFLPAIYYGYATYSEYSDERQEFFANLVNYKNLAVGCTYQTCANPDRRLIRCKYNSPTPQKNALLYNRGMACQSNSDCTLVTGSTCVNSLCVTTQTVLPPQQRPICQFIEMTDAARTTAVNMHNDYRAQVALGQAPNGKNGAILPQAANMMQMDYDCDLERYALVHAQTCSMTASADANLPDQNENIYVDKTTTDPNTAITNAINAWKNQLSQNGINNQVQYHNTLATKPGNPKAAITMIWAKTWRLGCSAVNCNANGMFVVCRYSPKGLQLNHLIYDPKSGPCTKCPVSAANCSPNGALCVM
ncbi:hypothetical protein Q1695_010485 [Nippostrongylus brasiliensis]|nr:hypothetical protein Q1695_010485 [Nippostrongylus brasiliensis]